MCIGLGLIFGIMRIVNFAQGELLMLGVYTPACIWSPAAACFRVSLGPYVGPFVGALCAGPIVFAGGALLHRFLIARVSGLRTAGSIDDGHFGQLLVTLGISLILQNGGLIVLRLHARDSAHAACTHAPSEISGIYGRRHRIPQQSARLIACAVAIVTAIALYLVLEYTCLGKALRAAADNPTAATYMGIDVDRAYPHRVRPRLRHHRGGRRPDGHLSVVRPVHRHRLRDHHVFRRRARWHGQHLRRILGRPAPWVSCSNALAGIAACNCRMPRLFVWCSC